MPQHTDLFIKCDLCDLSYVIARCVHLSQSELTQLCLWQILVTNLFYHPDALGGTEMGDGRAISKPVSYQEVPGSSLSTETSYPD
jgi:hypothetical protein